jgi:broad specificity phosphatase PhoE
MSLLLGSITRSLAAGVSAVLFLSAPCAAQQAQAATTVILVRHAEKADTGDDPPLTEEGRERALALAHVLGEVDLAAIYATPYIRTRETALPLARLRGIPVTTVPADDYGPRMAAMIRSQHVGQTVALVSHSNTVPALIKALGAGPAPIIDEDEYDDLYVITIDAAGNATCLNLRYGAETP